MHMHKAKRHASPAVAAAGAAEDAAAAATTFRPSDRLARLYTPYSRCSRGSCYKEERAHGEDQSRRRPMASPRGEAVVRHSRARSRGEFCVGAIKPVCALFPMLFTKCQFRQRGSGPVCSSQCLLFRIVRWKKASNDDDTTIGGDARRKIFSRHSLLHSVRHSVGGAAVSDPCHGTCLL